MRGFHHPWGKNHGNTAISGGKKNWPPSWGPFDALAPSRVPTFDISKIHSHWLHFFSPWDLATDHLDLALHQVLNHRLLTLFSTNRLRHITSMSRDIFEWDPWTNPRPDNATVHFRQSSEISERCVIAPL
jgi:hypothetical protein